MGDLGAALNNIVTQEEREKYNAFSLEQLGKLGRTLPPEIWHYTSAEALIEILKTGQIFSTQIACLNDNFEQRYFGDLVLAEARSRQAKSANEYLKVLYRVVIDALVERDFSAVGHFVTCFSEIEDDLNQWRGYGGGECGYAIGFDTSELLNFCKRRPSTIIAPMNYESPRHDIVVQEVAAAAERFFLERVERGVSDIGEWAKQFVQVFANELDIVASIIKHPKFAGEKERRIATLLHVGEEQILEFRQKRTLLARHLPLNLLAPELGISALPITRVYIGPSPAQNVTKISVGDLLIKFGYRNVKVVPSNVPYRVP